MNYLGHICRDYCEQPGLTQRVLAERLGISLGKCNSLVRNAAQAGYLTPAGHAKTRVTPAGHALLQPLRVRNAVLFADRVDPRFVSHAPGVPKPLLRVRGEVLVERLIAQLRAKGITDITVVVGYQAERLEYLAGRYGASLVYNPDYVAKGNLASLYLVRERLGNSYMLNAGCWLEDGLFHEYEPESWCTCYRESGATDALCLNVDSRRRILGAQQGGSGMLVRGGPLFFGMDFSRWLASRLEDVWGRPGLAAQSLEGVLAGNLAQLPLYANVQPKSHVHSFASMEQLRRHDNEANREGLTRQMARLFHVPPAQVEWLGPLRAASLGPVQKLGVGSRRYAYRQPGEAVNRFVTYKQEASVYRALAPLDITDRLVCFEPETGDKVSEYFTPAAELEAGRPDSLREPALLLRRLHHSGARVRHHFNIAGLLRSFDALCRREGCVLFADYEQSFASLRQPLEAIAAAKQPLVLCHLNVPTIDFLRDEKHGLRMACWEYSGMCVAEADIAMLALQFGVGPQQAAQLLEWYGDGPPGAGSLRLMLAYGAAGALLWSLFGEHAQHRGYPIGGFALQMYRLCKEYQRVLEEMDIA